MKTKRIEWQELRKGECGGWELSDLIADTDEKDPTGWAFYEKTTWDLIWIRIPATPCRLAMVSVKEAEYAASDEKNYKIGVGKRQLRQPVGPPCELNPKRASQTRFHLQRRQLCFTQVRLDRRMGHTSSARHLQCASFTKLIERESSRLPARPQGGSCESELAHTDNDDQPPPKPPSGFLPWRLLIATS